MLLPTHRRLIGARYAPRRAKLVAPHPPLPPGPFAFSLPLPAGTTIIRGTSAPTNFEAASPAFLTFLGARRRLRGNPSFRPFKGRHPFPSCRRTSFLRRTVFVSTGNEGGAADRLERWL